MDSSYIGKPITYTRGPNAGKTIRAELQEYQKPDLGRKFAKRDRRPLDPPPVVRVRLWEVFDIGLPTQSERELPADDVEVQGLVAHVDLFRVNPDNSISSDNANETASLTKHTFGSSFVHATHILDLTGQPVIIFVFADLSVRLEGVFALRYRIFDLVSRIEGSEAIPVAAELFGGVFTVYSTKEFPGLQASTPLTKHLSRWGVRVNLREGERKRKPSGAGGPDDDDDDDDDGEDDDGGDGAGAGSSKKAGTGGKGGRGGRGGGKGKGPSSRSVTLSKSSANGQPAYAHLSQEPRQSVSFASSSGGSTAVQPSRPNTSSSPDSPSRRTGSEGGEEDQTRDTLAPRDQPPGEWVSPPDNWSRAPVNGWSRPPTVPSQAHQQHEQQPIIGDWSRTPEKHYMEARSPGSGQHPQEVLAPADQARKRFRMNQAGYEAANGTSALNARPVDVVVDMSLSASPTRMLSSSNHPLALDASPLFMAHGPPPPSYSAASYSPPPGISPAHRYATNTTFAPPLPASGSMSNHPPPPSHPRMLHATSYAVPSDNGPFGYRSSR